jgi:hypothetical protein
VKEEEEVDVMKKSGERGKGGGWAGAFVAPGGTQNLKFEMRDLKWGILESKVHTRGLWSKELFGFKFEISNLR